jgi:hypothetical protein
VTIPPRIHPRAVSTIDQDVGAAVKGQAVPRVGAAGGEPPLVLGVYVSPAALFCMPPHAGGLGVGRVDDGQYMALEVRQGAGGVDPLAQQLGPAGLVHAPDPEAVFRLGGAIADHQAGRRELERGDHRSVRDLDLEGHGVRRPVEEAEQLGVLWVGHIQDAPSRVPEPGDVEEEPAVDVLQGQLESRPAVEVVIGEQIDVVVPHVQASG